MIYTTMDKLNAKPSLLGFGGMRFPLLPDGKIDRTASAEMIDLAIQNGVNYFDTAYGYHYGESEVFFGEALSRYPRDSYYLADKLPTWLLKADEPGCTDRLFAEQQGRCKTDYFDYYLLHCLDAANWDKVKQAGAVENLLKKKEEGKIRALGFSFHGDWDTFLEIIESGPWDFVQIQHNYLDDKMMDSRKYADKLREKGIPIIVMEPVRGGYLAALPPSSQQELDVCGAGTPSSWALRWCIDQPGVVVILSGMSTLQQVQDNLTTFGERIPLTPAQKTAIDKTRDAILAVDTVPCTQCGYCMDCDFGVNIPQVFSTYMQLQRFGNAQVSMGQYAFVSPERDARNCTECGVCVSKCPQGIDIPVRLAEAHSAFIALQK